MVSYLSDRAGARYLEEHWTRQLWSLSSRGTQDSREGGQIGRLLGYGVTCQVR